MLTEPDDIDDKTLAPELPSGEWDGLSEKVDELDPDEIEIVEELAGGENEDDVSPDEEDDNPYQESDEALPDDSEEKAIDDLLRKDGAGRFGDT